MNIPRCECRPSAFVRTYHPWLAVNPNPMQLTPCTAHGAPSSGYPSAFRRFMAGMALLLLAALTAWGQADGATGIVTGRVLNLHSGRYLNNARVTVQGTGISTFTDEYGQYRLTNVPTGEQQLLVFYSGLGESTVPVTVTAGRTVTQNVNLGGTADDDTVMLDTFTVSSGRETDIASIAVNEQRFAPNIKTVIETDAFGDIAEGNVGEFLKFLPGVTVDYVAADVRTVSVRGLAAAFTTVSIDGFRMASAASGSATRAFEFEQVSINNTSRVEVTKVPTPDVSAEGIGGTVNMVSKNAFERPGKQFNYRFYLNMNHEEAEAWDKTPGPGDKETYKVLPGFDFDFTLPVTENLGFVITGLSSNQYNEQHRSQPQWNFNQAGASVTNPYLQQFQLQDGPKNSFRDSVSIKMDWRFAPQHVLSLAYQFNYYKAFFGNRNLTWNAGTNPAPTPASGTPLTWGQDFTEGATGRGTVRHGTSFRDKLGATQGAFAKYRYDGADWDIDAGLAGSVSRGWYRDMDRGQFSAIQTTLVGGTRVSFSDIEEEGPKSIHVYTPAGEELDWSNLSLYRLNTARTNPLDARDEFVTLHVNAKRDLDLPFPASIRLGAERREQNRDIRRRDVSWNFVGPDGVANTADDNAAAFLDEQYGVYPYFNYKDLQWPSPFKVLDAFQQNPGWFVQTPDQARNAERFRIQNSQDVTETVDSLYIRGDARFMNGKLQIVTGVRYENAEIEGDGPLTPTPGATLADVQANWRERGFHVEREHDGFYPSFHANYNITDDLVLRFAYAQTIGRPDFGNVLPLVRVNPTETDSDDGAGTLEPRTIRYNNTGLVPYEGDNYDLSLEYYFRNGGVVSAGVFRKDLTNFIAPFSGTADAALLQELNLSDEYLGFQVLTEVNVPGTSKINGVEFSYRQRLDFFGPWGEKFEFFANATRLDLDGESEQVFDNFIEEAANAGITYRGDPLTLRLNVNYRGRQILGPLGGNVYGNGNNIGEYFADRIYVDVNAEYKLSRALGFFLNVRNVFNEPQDNERYNDDTPGYARMFRREKFGAQITLGVKGTF